MAPINTQHHFAEMNTTHSTSCLILLPDVLTGWLNPSKERDRFRFRFKRGKKEKRGEKKPSRSYSPHSTE